MGKIYFTDRRALLKNALMVGAYAVGAKFIASPTAAWALEVKNIKPDTMATLVQMAKDIYPHNRIATKYYVKAVKGFDKKSTKDIIEKGVAELNKTAGGSYLKLGWEKDRVNVLRKIEKSEFFQTVRGHLVVGLYNQEDVWPLFGYQGASFAKGGYIHRGFNDIDWL